LFREGQAKQIDGVGLFNYCFSVDFPRFIGSYAGFSGAMVCFYILWVEILFSLLKYYFLYFI